MTAQELLRLAKNINPNKFEEDPEAAIQDAYMVFEAVRIANLEKVSTPHNLPPGKVTATLYKPREGKSPRDSSTIDHLKRYMKQENLTANAIASKLKLTGTSALYHWLKGKYKPNAKSIAKIEGFLHDAGYYE